MLRHRGPPRLTAQGMNWGFALAAHPQTSDLQSFRLQRPWFPPARKHFSANRPLFSTASRVRSAKHRHFEQVLWQQAFISELEKAEEELAAEVPSYPSPGLS